MHDAMVTSNGRRRRDVQSIPPFSRWDDWKLRTLLANMGNATSTPMAIAILVRYPIHGGVMKCPSILVPAFSDSNVP
jgi:hypothetical protein